MKKWADLGRLLGYGGIPGLSSQLKITYSRVILPYEDFLEGVRKSPSSSATDATPHTPTTVAKRSENVPSDAADTPASPLSNSSSPLSEPPDDGEHVNGAHHEHHKSRKDPGHDPSSISNESASKKLAQIPKSYSTDTHKNKNGNEVRKFSVFFWEASAEYMDFLR